MKRLSMLGLGLLVCLWPTVVLADGLIVVTKPPPEMGRRGPVRHRFAPLNINYHKVERHELKP